jgi:cyclic pyranopterin phosphate synthase
MSDFTHFDDHGRAQMVDVGAKDVTHRLAIAEGAIHMQPETLELIVNGGVKKGDVFAVARIAGIMAAKRTSELVPLCHPLALTRVTIDLSADPTAPCVRCSATVETRGQTGVEMEALCAVQVALLTVYDMCKAVDRGMTIDRVRLREKSGGRAGHWQRGD